MIIVNVTSITVVPNSKIFSLSLFAATRHDAVGAKERTKSISWETFNDSVESVSAQR